MTWRDAAIGRIISQSDFFEPLSPGLPHHARFRRRVYFPTGKGFIALQIMPAPTPRNKAVAMPNTLFIVVSISLLVIVFSEALRSRVYAQDLEPRAYAVTPVGLNFLIGGYAYSKGAVGTDPSVPIEDAEVKVNSAVVAYVRTLDLWGRSGKFDIILPYSWVSGSAKFAGQPQAREVSGLGDPRLRFSMLLYGGPALSLDEFADFKSDIIIGTSLEVTPPLGQYDSDKLLNIGTNRWSFKPEVGVSKTWGPLTLELATGVRFYTDNNNFFDGKTLQLSPIYSVQGHLIYSITPGIWLGLDGLYYTGARGTIDGRKGESVENVRVGLTLALPINRYNSVKLYGSTNIYTKTGTDFDVVGIAWQFRWGAGL